MADAAADLGVAVAAMIFGGAVTGEAAYAVSFALGAVFAPAGRTE